MTIRINDISYKSDSIKFNVYYNSQTIKFPVTDISIYDLDNGEKSFILEMNLLWQNDKLATSESGYHLELKRIQNNVILRNILNIPVILDDIECNLTHRSFLGSKNFTIEANLRKVNTHINIIKRQGSYVLTNMDTFLLPEQFADLLDLVDEMNSKSFENAERQFELLAKIKKISERYENIHLDSYMTNEEVYFPEELDLDIYKKSDSEILLEPKYNDLPKKVNDVIGNIKGSIDSFSQVNGRKRSRVFFDQAQKNNVNKVKATSSISNSDVPRFINNPEAFLDEDIKIDMNEFSKRVKGLNILTYKSQPFVNVTQTKDRDWFNINTGVRLVDETNQEIVADELDIDIFDKMLETARNKEDDFIYHNGKWINIDIDSGESFLQANRELKGMETPQGIHKSKVNGVLEIYQNIERLEYNEEFFAIREKLEKEGTYHLPENLKATLYNHQIIGYNWLRNLSDLNLGGLLADDMGLGKTLQLISLIAHHKIENNLRPSLIVVPSILIENWCEELRKFIDIPPQIYTHHGSTRVKDKDWIEEQELVITTYDTLKRDQLIFGKIDWKILICDEAQKIKNPTTVVSNAVKAMKSKYRYTMTGTPVENSLSELWSIVDFIQPGYLDSLSIFKKKYVHQNDFQDMSVYEQLRKRIEPIFLRREKRDILNDLPNKVEHKILCKMSEKQRIMYGHIIQEAKNTGNFLPAVQKLIQLCSHPNLIERKYGLSEDELILDCPKLEKTMEIISEIKDSKEKVLIFTKYIDMQRILQMVIMNKFGITPQIINGQVTGNRQQLIHWFNKTDGFNVLILSPRAAGVGLNITSANHVIHYTREWNPAIENQATDRAHRIGQKKKVQVYYPVVSDSLFETAEQKISALLDEKSQLYTNVMIPTGKLEISKEELFKIINAM